MSNSLRTACGGKMIITQKARDHLRAHQGVLAHLPEAVSKFALPATGGFIEAEIDLGRTIGTATLVEISEGDEHTPALFSLRHGRPYPSRVVPAETLRPATSMVSIVAKPVGRCEYLLVTAWIGKLAAKEPWDRHLGSKYHREAALKFWCSHALIHDPASAGDIFESTWHEVMRIASSNPQD